MFNVGRIRVIALALADAVCLTVSWAAVVGGYWALGWLLLHMGVRTGIGGYAPADYLSFWPILPAFIALNAFLNLYQGNWMYPSAPLSPVEEMRRLFGSAFIAHVGVMAFLAFSRQTTQDYSRFVIAMSGLSVALVAQPLRDAVRRLMMAVGIGQLPVVLVGSGQSATRVVRALRNNAYIGFRVIGYFDRDNRALEDLPRLGGLRDAVRVARARGVRTLLACEEERIFRCQLRDYTEWFTHIEYLPSAEMFPVFGSQTISIGGVGGIEMVNQGRMRFLRVEKWLLDKTLAVVAFVLLSPLFVLLPLLIKLTGRGPVFYCQNRLGRHGKPIRVWKFRSMYADADERLKKILAEQPALAEEWKRSHKLAKDPRVTPFGRFLRKTSLDEIPQLFNVFGGSMALVGPRPIVQEEVGFYGDTYDIFSSVKPGVTGLWQVSGRSDTDYGRRVALDAQYVLNWSPWMDIWILIRTVGAVVTMRGSC